MRSNSPSALTRLFLCAAIFSAISYGAWPSTAAAIFNDDVLKNDVLGSFLVFSKFDIRQDRVTELRIVNNGDNIPDITGNIPDLRVRLNYVCPGVKFVNDRCPALNTELRFTPHQTRIVNVADQNPPCNQGFVVAYALTPDGDPANYNFLGGGYTITAERRLEGDNAIAIKANAVEQCFDCSEGRQVALNGVSYPGALTFGLGGMYEALPSKLYTDFRAVDGDGKIGSVLTVLSLDVLAGMQNPAATVFVDFWNAAEVPFSTSFEFICWNEVSLQDIDANFLTENLGTNFGSMTLFAVPNCPIAGGCPPLDPYDAAILGTIDEFGDGVANSRNLFHNEWCKEATFLPR